MGTTAEVVVMVVADDGDGIVMVIEIMVLSGCGYKHNDGHGWDEARAMVVVTMIVQLVHAANGEDDGGGHHENRCKWLW